MEVMENIVVRQDFDLEFLAKAKPLRPRPRPMTNITGQDVYYVSLRVPFLQRMQNNDY